MIVVGRLVEERWWDKLLVRSLFVSNDIDGEYDECRME